MIPFTENLRFAYTDIKPEDWVLEIGAHMGQTAHILHEKFGCYVVCFEPITDFFDRLIERFNGNEKIITVNSAVGNAYRREMFGVHGDLSGIACVGDYHESVSVVPIVVVLKRYLIDFGYPPKLLCLNCEGSEYPILESLLDNQMDVLFDHIQVQPHDVVDNAAERWAKIRERLLEHFTISSEDPTLGTGWLLLDRR